MDFDDRGAYRVAIHAAAEEHYPEPRPDVGKGGEDEEPRRRVLMQVAVLHMQVIVLHRLRLVRFKPTNVGAEDGDYQWYATHPARMVEFQATTSIISAGFDIIDATLVIS